MHYTKIIPFVASLFIRAYAASPCGETHPSQDGCITRTVTATNTYSTDTTVTLKPTPRPITCPSKRVCPNYVNWKTYKANGVNLGGWLELEKVFYPVWWNEHAPDAVDEWTFCEALGDQCRPVLETHYATYVTKKDIDKVAGVGVEVLRIPVTYAAFIKFPGSKLHHGSQLTYLREITQYAIEKYNMHIILGLHSLPGGVNTLDIGEALGHDKWFYNETNLNYAYDAVDKVLDFIKDSGHPGSFTFSPINEASDNIAGFGTPKTLTTKGTAWVVKYTRGVIKRVKAKLPCLPIMLQDCFMGEKHWSPYFDKCDNIVMDIHIYYFAAAGIYGQWVTPTICGQATGTVGDGKLPIFVGEWALQVLYNNTFAGRELIFNTQRYAWHTYLHGGTFWSIKHASTAKVDGQGLQRDYWSYEGLIDEGVIKPVNESVVYC